MALFARPHLGGITLTVALVLLIAFAATEIAIWLAVVMVAIIAGGGDRRDAERAGDGWCSTES